MKRNIFFMFCACLLMASTNAQAQSKFGNFLKKVNKADASKDVRKYWETPLCSLSINEFHREQREERINHNIWKHHKPVRTRNS